MACRKPFSRHPRGEHEPDGWDPVRAVELAAATYGWTFDVIESRLTDEQLVALFDAYADRVSDQSERDWEHAVEAVRVGTIFAHENDQYRRWQRAPKQKRLGKPLAGASLEAAVMRIADIFPGNVIRETA